MKTLTLFFVSLIAYAQLQTPLTVLPGAGTAPGSIRLRERRSNGTNYFALKASPSMASDVEIQAPPDYPATNGE
ncbi:MAG TPA: hypothetical protein PKH07_15645, partial [bacterium]|nr:hypothetical protein [bacterium]